MEKLIVKFTSLDGEYEISVDINDTITYIVNSTIKELISKNGELSKDEIGAFINKLKEVNLINWEKEYLPTGLKIDDSVVWNVAYIVNDKEYHFSGEEGYWPYTYDDLIGVLSIADNNIKYFISNQK